VVTAPLARTRVAGTWPSVALASWPAGLTCARLVSTGAAKAVISLSAHRASATHAAVVEVTPARGSTPLPSCSAFAGRRTSLGENSYAYDTRAEDLESCEEAL
jgi:hypothetical protein